MFRLQTLGVFLLCLSLGPVSANADIIFSNTFEDGNAAPELGTWTFGSSPVTALVPTSVSPDPTLGSSVFLIDQENPQGSPLDLQLNFSDANNSYACADLTNGNTLTMSFDVSSRRTNGTPKTHYIKALDINGATVMEFVLGDGLAFGAGAFARQRPGYRTSTGSTALSTNFFWGADTSPASFDVIRDGHFDLTIGENGWNLAGTKGGGAAYAAFGLPTYTGGSFSNIASFDISSNGPNFGLYWDNIVIDATAPVIDGAAHVPEPGSSALLLMAALGMVARRKRQS